MADKYSKLARIARREHQVERCDAKRNFPSKAAALQINRGQRPYRCKVCGNWHLASYKVRAALQSPVPHRYRQHHRTTPKRG